MSKRNYVEEILSIRIRNELNPRWGGALIQLLALESAVEKAKDLPSGMVRYFPIAMVATIEGYFRSAIKELIDFGPPYSENAESFEKQRGLPIDFKAILAIQGRTITAGDLLGHILPFSSLDDINRNMTTVIGESFLEKLKQTQDRWAIEVEGKAPAQIINSPSDVYRDVRETFRLRHIYCHEVAYFERPDVELISRCFENSSLFLKAADQLIWNLVAPNAPLTQSAMNEKAFLDFNNTNQQLESLCTEIVTFLDDDEKKEFAAAQEAWTAFRKLEQSSYANRWGRGGTIWPTLNSRQANTLTLLRIEELKRELEHLRKQRSRHRVLGDKHDA